MASEWDSQNISEVVFGMGDFNEHVGRWIDGFEGVHGGYGIGKTNVEGRRVLEFVTKKSCAWQIHSLKRRSREK